MPFTLKYASLVLSAALIVLVVLHYGLHALPWPWSGFASVSYNLLFGVTAITALHTAGRLRAGGDRRGAVAWRWISVCVTAMLLAQGVNVFRRGDASLPAADVFALAAYPAGIVAITRFGPSRRFRAVRAVASIDLVMLGVAAFTIWLAVELSRASGQFSLSIATHFYSVFIPAFAVVTASAGALFFMRRSAAQRPGDAWAVAALLLFAGSDMSFAISRAFWDVSSTVLWAAACLMLVTGATTAAVPAAGADSVVRGPSVVPYLAIGGVIMAMIGTVWRLGHPEPLYIGAGGALMVLLLIVRQWQVLQANAELERRSAEQERRLREAERLDALGRMARGVAHDFNNMMMVISANAELAEEYVGRDPVSARESLRHIRAAVVTASGLTAQLLAFARGGMVEMLDVDLAAVTRQQWPLLSSALPAFVQARLDAPSEEMVVRTGAGFIEQLLHNLVANARDAMPAGGTLSLSLFREDAQVVLRVCDTGHGMDEATRARIFEPFFSTKGGRGSGLGLATVYGIVRQSGGDIDVKSAPGAGTTFTVRFPGSTA